MMKTCLVSFDGLLFMIGEADEVKDCLKNFTELSCNLPTKAPEGQSESESEFLLLFCICYIMRKLRSGWRRVSSAAVRRV